MRTKAFKLEDSTRVQAGNQQSVSIIIPCFNESEGIAALKTRLLPVVQRLRLVRSVELVFVDDGSSDDTFFKLQQNFGSQAQILRHQRNKGICAAINTGFVNSTGEIVCTVDSDCTYDPQDLLPLLDLLADGVDIVTASPYHPKGAVNNVPAWRLVLSKGLSQIYRIVLPKKLYTYTSMFRAYRREVLEEVAVTYPGFLGLVEVLVEAILRGYAVVEYPTELSRRAFGQSKLRVAKVTFSHLKYIGQLMFRRLTKRKKVKAVVRRSY